jgi:hypothetical protein
MAVGGCADGPEVDLRQGGVWLVYADATMVGRVYPVAAADAASPPVTAEQDAAVAADVGGGDELDGSGWGAGPDTTADAGPPSPPACPEGVVCVEALPFTGQGDTTTSSSQALDGYSCAPEVDESGAEIVYRVEVPQAGFLSAAVFDGPAVDVDVHILSAPDAASCLDRGNHHAGADVGAGTWWVVVDTWVDEDSTPLAGAYTLQIGLYLPSSGPCPVEVGEMPRVGDGGDHLAMPATGPMVLEAHLVTQDEPPPYPSSSTEELASHYTLSQAATGLVMRRDQVWAPLEGGDFYGAGIGSPTLFPVLDEGWYVNMYWTKDARPDRGTRMVLRDPAGDRAVVVAAGYETGPGNLANIGGTTEETHFYLGTGHKSVLTLGLASDQDLPLGPRVCTD